MTTPLPSRRLGTGGPEITTVGFGAWAIHARTQGGDLLEFVLGLISLAAGVALIVYFKAVLRKLRNISYL